MKLVKTMMAAAAAAACVSVSAAGLPNIAVLATGGTIAGAGNSATGSSYTAGKVSVNPWWLLFRSLPKSPTSFPSRSCRSVLRT